MRKLNFLEVNIFVYNVVYCSFLTFLSVRKLFLFVEEDKQNHLNKCHENFTEILYKNDINKIRRRESRGDKHQIQDLRRCLALSLLDFSRTSLLAV